VVAPVGSHACSLHGWLLHHDVLSRLSGFRRMYVAISRFMWFSGKVFLVIKESENYMIWEGT
jgi:hypothetical protein